MTSQKPATTKLGQAQQKKAAPPSKFTQALSGARVKEPFVIPRLNLPAVMTLVATNRITEIEGATWQRMRDLGLELNTTTEAHFELERAARVLAEAVLDPEAVAREDYTVKVGTYAEWMDCDPDIVAECWRMYGSLREAIDPIDYPLTDEERRDITEAVKKKQGRLLRYYGARRLATWLTTTEGLPSSSPEPSYGNSESSEETSPRPAPPVVLASDPSET